MIKRFLKSNLIVLFLSISSCSSKGELTPIDVESDFQLNVATSVYENNIAVINGLYQIPYACPLDLSASKIKSGMKFASYFNLDMRKMVPTIGDLKPKYIMLKKKNENLVYGIKRGDTLAFKLIDFKK